MDFLKRFAAPAGALVLLSSLAANLILPERPIPASILLGVGLMLVLLGVFFNSSEILARLRGRAAREGGGDVAYIIAVGVTLALLNFLAARHHKRYDLTEQGAFSLSDQTRKILAGLPRDVEARAYYYPSTLAEQKARDLLEEYAYQAPARFRYQVIDPVKNPAQAKEDAITQEQSVVIRSGGQSSTVVSPDEEAITNAILKVTRDEVKTVCFTIGHGEKDPNDTGPQGYSSFRTAIEKQQSKVETFSPAMGMPENCAEVVVAGPRKPWLPGEVEKLQEFLDRGGRAAILVDPEEDSGLGPLLSRFGITLRHDLIISRVSALFGGKPNIPMVPGDGYESHPITKGFSYQTFYPLATSLEVAPTPPTGVTVQALAKTTSLSWGETDYQKEAATGKLRLGPGDHPGPLVVAAVATRKVDERSGESASADMGKKPPVETRLVVFGDSDFPSNSYYNATSNGELFQNAANWLAGQEDLVAIPPKSRLPSLVTLTQQQANLIWIVSILIAPSSILAVGTAIWFRRRRL